MIISNIWFSIDHVISHLIKYDSTTYYFACSGQKVQGIFSLRCLEYGYEHRCEKCKRLEIMRELSE